MIITHEKKKTSAKIRYRCRGCKKIIGKTITILVPDELESRIIAREKLLKAAIADHTRETGYYHKSCKNMQR